MEKNLRLHILALPRIIKRLIVILLDGLLVVIAVWLAFYLRIGDFLPLFKQTAEYIPLFAVFGAVIISVPIFMVMGLYRTIFRYSDGQALIAIWQACAWYGFVFVTIFTVIGIDGVPRTVGIIQPLILFILMPATRISARLWLGGLYRDHLIQSHKKRALIYGAGAAGRDLAAALTHNVEIKIVGFLDDDESLQGQKIRGLPVLDPRKIIQYSKELSINEIVLALPSLGRKRRNQIIKMIQASQIALRTLPSYSDLVNGRITLNDVKDLSIDDILGREAITPDLESINSDINGKVVLVTGAGGSIGSELCKQILKQKPSKLILFEQSELALYAIINDLEKTLKKFITRDKCHLLPVLGSITDRDSVRKVLETERPQTMYHAAAYKHVPLVEANPFEGIKNNVFGTLICAENAIDAGVKKFVLISTDKAVRPTNIMGASKRLAEMLIQAISEKQSQTTFAMVRFGNVLGSSGSVVPLFREQIKSGGPVTVTHKEVTRYFMTVSEAAQLVMQAGEMTKKTKTLSTAPLYLLDMGDPVNIYDLACRMIELSGFRLAVDSNPDGDIEIEIIGMRPGEKLYEELLIGDKANDTSHPKITVADETFLNWENLQSSLDQLLISINTNDLNLLKKILSELVSGYQEKYNLNQCN